MIAQTFTTPSGKTWDRSKPVDTPLGLGYLTGDYTLCPDKIVGLDVSIQGKIYFYIEDFISQQISPTDHPPHYGGDSTYEAIKVIEAWGLGFCLGNVVKYISRAGKKDSTKRKEDLEKALWYLKRELGIT